MGSAPPSFSDAWPTLQPLLSNARAVVVVLMAGRSSANSAFPYVNDGRTSGEKSMARDAGMRHLVDSKDPCLPQLINESLATALGEYTLIATNIREHARRVGLPTPQSWVSSMSSPWILGLTAQGAVGTVASGYAHEVNQSI